MTLWLMGLMLACMSTTPLLALDFQKYHSQDEINWYLAAMSEAKPQLVETKLLGYSYQGREINYAIIQPKDGQPREAIFINGTHHGNEKSSTESVLGLMDYLLAHQKSARVSQLLSRYAIYILPLVNPDGHAANTRMDAHGRDLNRDYAYPERSLKNSFKSESTRLIKNLMDQVPFRAALAYHAGMEAILWPACYTDVPPTHRSVFRTLAQRAAAAMGISRYLQSYRDYPTEGEFIDFAYATYGTLAVTLEVSEDPTPPEAHLLGIVERSIAGAMSYMTGVMDLGLGRLEVKDEPQSPFGSSRNQFEVQTGSLDPSPAHH